ncbi:hypothetical protein ISF_00592 [Cordyceps fumosorosea ARSEF 2679]|uniref:Mucin n=1 Tax=Cordyceps fumosorosea (strain ARSEF 2679) TaxID=1081104 RepID=A0A168EDQ0_CORFA|nr:hypothetical protein ISF_00592 [Cordyceps fumosorosea ARSEF 2679]OAA73691.1 hypothetical protein ISF_00592 [Cordyceps fumosorosea ARSEF 2679]
MPIYSYPFYPCPFFFGVPFLPSPTCRSLGTFSFPSLKPASHNTTPPPTKSQTLTIGPSSWPHKQYFSTLERLRFAQDPDTQDSNTTPSPSFDNLPKLHPNINPVAAANTNSAPLALAASTPRSLQDSHRPVRLTVLSKLPSETPPLVGLGAIPQRPRSALVRLHSSPALDRHTTSTKLGLGILHNRSDNHHTSTLPSYRHSVILDATDEALIKRGKRNVAQPTARQSNSHLHRAASFESLRHSMHSRIADAAWMDGRLKETEDSLYDSLRWLEDDIDLRLDLDDYQVREDAPCHKKRSASFRRKLSISSKVTFGRASSTLSRPTTKEGIAPFGGSVLSLHNPPGNGHVRRRSRALSLMSATKQPPVDVAPASPPPIMDPAAHYQDPEARMKLRVYLASPHKFDEAVEFGFPSTEQQPSSPTTPPKRLDSLPRNAERGGNLRMQTLVEDRRCSLYSDETNATEPDSPRTPDTLEKPSAPFTTSMEQDRDTAKVDYAQAHAYSREMTLRMTLTRPDLRANESQIYGWQNKMSPAVSDSPRSSSGPRTEDELKKDSIERQLAAIDQENLLYPEQSSMKRFWNRVRRT